MVKLKHIIGYSLIQSPPPAALQSLASWQHRGEGLAAELVVASGVEWSGSGTKIGGLLWPRHRRPAATCSDWLQWPTPQASSNTL